MTRVSVDGDERSTEAADNEPPHCGQPLTTGQADDEDNFSGAMVRPAIGDGPFAPSLRVGRTNGRRSATGAVEEWLTRSRVDPKQSTRS